MLSSDRLFRTGWVGRTPGEDPPPGHSAHRHTAEAEVGLPKTAQSLNKNQRLRAAHPTRAAQNRNRHFQTAKSQLAMDKPRPPSLFPVSDPLLFEMNFVQKSSVSNVLRITVPTGILVEVGELTLNITWKPKGKDSQDTLKEKTVRQTAYPTGGQGPTRRGAPAPWGQRRADQSGLSADPHTDARGAENSAGPGGRRFFPSTGPSWLCNRLRNKGKSASPQLKTFP